MTAGKRDALGLGQPFVAPQTADEIAVAGIMGEVLELDAIGLDDRFFDLGLDSFAALKVSLAAEERLGIALDTNWMTDEATLRSLCARIRRR